VQHQRALWRSSSGIVLISFAVDWWESFWDVATVGIIAGFLGLVTGVNEDEVREWRSYRLVAIISWPLACHPQFGLVFGIFQQ